MESDGIAVRGKSFGDLWRASGKTARRKPVNTGILFEPFGQYFHYLSGGLRQIICVFLWPLLFVIPGIIALYRYALTEYIILDHPETGNAL